jgi:hypothetical protein
MNSSARLYQCARCHRQVTICSRCDRGNVYCTEGCTDLARRISQRRAAQRYRRTRHGRHCNAERQHRFRARQREKVTHQGSAQQVALVPLRTALKHPTKPWKQPRTRTASALVCQFCQRPCDPFLRHTFLRPRERGKPALAVARRHFDH